ncbi:tRNA(fMet)-specific endonuclease VapC [Clostridia bacterium]|nr:tRNA(fMet)-specific endonuclease VapC [Clostridia bacterium]GHV18842.1 tRNA(fMet)-specific endonuclease VapC [Clostridia bacterium]GHV35116.1 tRNA(fMet)-specific endonuclease VapC [Clostridia bacterium]
MKYMLDSNVCIDMIRRNDRVIDKYRMAKLDGVCISAITLAELEVGVAKSTKPEKNRIDLTKFLTLVTVLPFDAAVTETYGKVRAALERKGRTIGALDTLIAAHAKFTGLTLVTNNTREFVRVEGLRLEDWID